MYSWHSALIRFRCPDINSFSTSMRSCWGDRAEQREGLMLLVVLETIPQRPLNI
jgi:hypothetical protein